MMSKKHYVEIAKAIRACEQPATVETAASISELAQRLASVFQNDNPRFDRARFLTACGLGEGK